MELLLVVLDGQHRQTPLRALFMLRWTSSRIAQPRESPESAVHAALGIRS